MALSGATALVGAQEGDGGIQDSGSAYVFVRSASAWTEQDELTASDGQVGRAGVGLGGDEGRVSVGLADGGNVLGPFSGFAVRPV